MSTRHHQQYQSIDPRLSTQDVSTQSQAEDQISHTPVHLCRCKATNLATYDPFNSSMDPREDRAQTIISKFSKEASSRVGGSNSPTNIDAEQEAADAHPTVTWLHTPEEEWGTRLRDAYNNARPGS